MITPTRATASDNEAVTTDEPAILRFSDGIIGLPAATQFVLTQVSPDAPPDALLQVAMPAPVAASSRVDSEDQILVRRGLLRAVADSLQRAEGAAAHAVAIARQARDAFEDQRLLLVGSTVDIQKSH